MADFQMTYAGGINFPEHAARNPRLKDETDQDYYKRLTTERGIALKRSDARNPVLYQKAHEAAAKKGVPVVYIENDPAFDDAVKLTRSAARDAQTYRKALTESEAKGVRLEIVED